ncbi:hypothetical protein CAPTEDRAFT_167179 [Capitella teleta]|uniref:WD repeat-containing protein 79 n=1 Tax=Capitella teleta TaxID=283909 RepID=R7UCR7_CAPTE|nr:hypothetical protein CAPTEDRAFT_167179 [Capitella teleta]|eukprot:ELU01042.1 hypothetical protein CAPTEDRAFT_167179 [Capitella teleta]
MDVDPTQAEILLCHARQDFQHTPENFLKGCKWSPDGSCLLTCSDDNCLRLFNTPYELYENRLTGIPDMTAVLKVKEGETVYDYAWYPLMSSADPDSCFFVSACRDHPVHMWDAHTGLLRASYRPYDHLDELASPYSLAFSPNGKRLLCGFYKIIRVFDVSRPGRECQNRKTYDKQGQGGMISCISVNPSDQSLYAAGSYNRSIAVYSEPRGEMICLLQGQTGGVTHLAFSADGTKLYSGGRKDPEILCWDMRNPGEVLFSMQRSVKTNQRMYFDQDFSGRYVVSGNHDGTVAMWDTAQDGLENDALLSATKTFQAHADCVNGVNLNPVMPVLATASGQRHTKFPSIGDSSSESEQEDCSENNVKLWWIGAQKETSALQADEDPVS